MVASCRAIQSAHHMISTDVLSSVPSATTTLVPVLLTYLIRIGRPGRRPVLRTLTPLR